MAEVIRGAEPLATDEMRRRLALAQDRQQGIGPDEGGRVAAINQWLPFSTNRPGSASWVTEGRNPQWAVPEILQSGLLGVAGAADAPRTGSLTPETLGLLLTSGPAMGGLLAPKGSVGVFGGRPPQTEARVAAKSLDEVREAWDAAKIAHAVHENNDVITLSKIVVPKEERGQGIGTSAMQSLIDYADATGKRIALSPSSDFGGSKARLVDFYKRFGFSPNKGRTKDFSISESMIREPPMKDRVY